MSKKGKEKKEQPVNPEEQMAKLKEEKPDESKLYRGV